MAKHGWMLVSRRPIDFAPGENTFGLTLAREEYRNSEGKTRVYFRYNCPDVALVVPFLADGRIIATTEWQPAIGATYLKMAGGNVEDCQTPLEAAHAELLEETGYETDAMELVTTMALDSGRSDRKLHIFLARNCRKTQEPENGIEVKLMTVAEFWERFTSYLFTNSEKVHGGANSLKAVATALAKIGILKVIS